MRSARRALGAVALALTFVVGASGVSVAAEPGAVSGEAPAVVAALAAAEKSGKSVVVPEETTEYAEVFANPDGTVTHRESFDPQRVRRGDAWVPVDLTMVARPDGTIGPKAAIVDVRVADGGEGELLATAAKNGSEIGIGWEGPLPAPKLNGSVATYAEVLPGVDLTVTATAKGFSQLLVVKTPEAAANPRLKEISFRNHARGVTPRKTSTGGIEAVDSAGRTVFGGDASKMWDSSGGGAAVTARSSAAVSPVPGKSAVATMDVEVTKDATIVRPDAGFLSDPARVYPIIIDPEYWWDEAKQSHAVVQSAWPNEHNFNRTDGALGDLKAGYQSGYVSRSYFNFNVSALRGKVIHRAKVRPRVIHSWSCNGGATELRLASGLDWGTTWANQPSFGGSLGGITTSNNAKYCPTAGAAEVVIDGAMRDAANGGWTNMVFLLKAANEGAENDWRRFALDPVLEVVYNSVPGLPADLGMEGGQIPCASGDARPFVFTPTPRLRGRVADPDGGMLTARFSLHKGKLGASSEVWWTTIGNVPSGSFAEVTVPTGKITDEGVYNWSMFASDGGSSSVWVGNCEFAVDKTPPGEPLITSEDYPGGGSTQSGGIGQTGAFTISANGSADVRRFLWSVTDQQNDDPQTPVNADTLGGSGVFRWTPTTDGPQTVFARSVDRAGNLSPIIKYPVYVRAGDPLTGNLNGHWKLDGDLADTSGNGRTLANVGGVDTTAEGYLGKTAVLGSGKRLHHAGPVVDTSKSFSVSAWVRLDQVGGWPAAVSEDGKRTSAFQLQASPDGKWSLAMFSSDVDGGGATHARALSATAVQTGVWTHLTGVYDQGAGKLRIYVNGALNGEIAYTSTWAATGDLQIGAALWNGATVDYFPGAVDDVRVYQRVLVPSEAAALANQAVLRAHYPLAEGTGAVTKEALTGQEAKFSGTAGWTEAEGYPAARFTGGYGTEYGAVTGPRPTLRTDRSYTVSAWVRLDEADGAPRTAVSLRDSKFSPFMLQYRSEIKKWNFLMSLGADREGGWWIPAEDEVSAQQWVHLTGVYDLAAKEARIYLNGRFAGRLGGVTGWNGTGEVMIGGGVWVGRDVDPFRGAIRDVRMYSGALSDRAISQLPAQG
ncbi:LamG-like jellyroll fold domain-containing protein [Amycolatopsis sp. TNS106]|uniref:LamG-like jellyroll fold domain-containing protein n=3 Tax=Amycolatopsis TaxID=1813 RepID=UPI002105AE2A|nr:LamG-like jellyroll fold domain-containing protein [Amycolatopsis sp. TNS106]